MNEKILNGKLLTWTDKIFKQININDLSNKFNLNNTYEGMIPEVLFQRIDKEKNLAEIENKLQGTIDNLWKNLRKE